MAYSLDRRKQKLYKGCVMETKYKIGDIIECDGWDGEEPYYLLLENLEYLSYEAEKLNKGAPYMYHFRRIGTNEMQSEYIEFADSSAFMRVVA